MSGCCVSWKCAVACLPGELSQQPTWPQLRQTRRLTHRPWVFRHSSQPLGVRGLTLRTWSRWLQGPATSAFVVLHHAGGAHVRLGGIVPGLLERPALAQQVPALVELGLDLREALALVRRRLGVLEQLVLFRDQLL